MCIHTCKYIDIYACREVKIYGGKIYRGIKWLSVNELPQKPWPRIWPF